MCWANPRCKLKEKIEKINQTGTTYSCECDVEEWFIPMEIKKIND